MSAPVTWPAGVPWMPFREPLQLQPMTSFNAVEMDQGWTDRESLFTVSPARYQVEIEATLRQFEILKGWWRLNLGRGARTFLMPVWTGEAYVETECRMAVEPWRAGQPDGDRWIAAVQIEILDLPTPDADVLAAMQIAEVMGAAGVQALADLSDLVHTDYPAAVA